MKNLERKIKRIGLMGTIATTLLLSGCSCSRKDVNVEETTLMSSEVETTENVTTVDIKGELQSDKEETTEKVTEVETELVTEEPTRSLDDAVNDYYELNKDFFESHGMGSNELKKTILVLNNVLTNDGELLVSREDIWAAYGNIQDILLPGEVLQKIDNINAKKMGIDLEDPIVLDEDYPSINNLLVVQRPGTPYVNEKVAEYDEFMKKLVKDLNNGTYDEKAIEEYVIKLNVDDVNADKTYLNKVNDSSEKYILATINFNVLQLAAMTHLQQEYINVNKDGVDRIKINPTNGESDIENAIIQLESTGLIDAAVIDEVVNYYKYTVLVGEEADAKVIEERFGVNLDQANLLIAYVTYKTRMPITAYYEMMCDAMARDVLFVEESYTYSLNEPVMVK